MRKYSLLLGVLIIGAFYAPSAHAASLYIDPAFSTLSRGDSVTLSVRLDTDEKQEECINAVDGVIKYSDNLVPVDTAIGDSIFSMWVEQPKIDKEKHTITFAGGIPNGYCGRIQGDPRLTNTIVKLIFRSPGFIVGGNPTGSSTAKVEFAPETTAYLNDGLGTKAQLALYGANFDMSDKAGPVLKDDWHQEVLNDTTPPEQFSIDLQRDKVAFNNKYFIVFNTTDKQTGIDQYQVMEEPISRLNAFDWGRANAPWITARSPYTLKDQSLNSIIRVKATDKAGNEYIATLVPDASKRTISSRDMIAIGGTAFVLLILLAMVLVAVRTYRKRKKTKATNPDNTNTYESK
jgi:hypothetical protein